MAPAPDQLSAKVEALRRPQIYPNGTESVEAIETHMSWVFLTDAHAYKLKKPVRTPALDYTTLEARRRACDTEYAINRALAESVYLGVVALVERDGNFEVDGEGAAADWLVKMRRLPDHLMLDARIGADQVDEREVDRVVAKLADFYTEADRASTDGPNYCDELVCDIDAKRASLEKPHYGLAHDDIAAAVGGLLDWLCEHGALLEERGASVVDAHGDLRPEHVCLEAEPVIIVRLEFDRSLRLLDPVSELAFLGLECRRLGATWIGPRLIDRYTQETGDDVDEALVAFYSGYHALVRAAIAVWHLDDDTLDHTALDHADRHRARARRYLDLMQKIL